MSVSTKLHVSNGDVTIERVQDVEPILEANKAEMNSHGDYTKFNGDMHKVASVPNVIIEQWIKEGINVFDPNHAAAVKRKLNSPEYAYLRTMRGRI